MSFQDPPSQWPAPQARNPTSMSSQIRIFGARQNNLKNLDVSIDTGQLLVLTGVSGSGKSSLAFDTLYAEGQRRYVETFSPRSEEHTSELQSLMRISYAVFCLQKKNIRSMNNNM